MTKTKRLNPIISDDPNAFGIAFDYSTNNVSRQRICFDCLVSGENSINGQSVRESVFTVEFHKRWGNIREDQPSNVQELFSKGLGRPPSKKSIRFFKS